MFPFRFIKYTQPGWQFNVLPKTDDEVASALYHPRFHPFKSDKIEIDTNFETDAARFGDVGFRCSQGGFMGKISQSNRNQISRLPPPSIADEYRFVAKYWGGFFSLYAFMARLISFHNPFKEIHAFVRSLKTKKVNQFQQLESETDYNNFNSSLLNEQPFVSVIIPTLNRYKYLKDALHDLEQQTYSNFEVIIIDQSENFNEDFYSDFNLKLQVKQQKEKLLWTARNNAIKISEANYLLFFDDDSRVQTDWIEQHMKAIDFYQSDISAGVSFATVGGKISAGYQYFKWADQFDSGNALVKRTVFEKIGLFDVQYNKMRQGDGEFGYRAFQKGFSSISNPKASRIHLKVHDGGLREIGSWDGFRQKKWFQPTPVPSVLFQYKKYLSPDLARHTILIGLILSNVHLKHKKNKYMLIISSVLFVLKSPLLFIQYKRSAAMANRMLQNDNGIKPLAATTTA